jgi:hypothetical protein
MPKGFLDRQAIAQLKMHLLMARLRTALRVMMDHEHIWKFDKWSTYVKTELVCDLSHPQARMSLIFG